MKSISLILVLFLSVLAASPGYGSSITVKRTIIAEYLMGPVENAQVTNRNETRVVSAVTHKDGRYTLVIDTSVTRVDSAKPSAMVLYQSFPNPFNPSTVIRFELQRRSTVSLDIFNITGQRVRTLLAGTVRSGPHAIVRDGCDGSGRPACA